MKNWKTTAIGIISGIGLACNAVVDAYNAGTFDSNNTVQLVLALAFVLLGVNAKDNNVTGGNIRQ